MVGIPHDPENPDQMRGFFGPQQADQMLRQALNVIWLMLPASRRTLGHVEAEARRLLDRALDNMKEDAGHFGFDDDKPAGG